MSKHIREPWNQDPEGEEAICIEDAAGAVVCWVERRRKGGQARADLIVAAPELLKAAKHAAMEWRLHGQLTDSCRVLEAAIAKAEGSGA